MTAYRRIPSEFGYQTEPVADGRVTRRGSDMGKVVRLDGTPARRRSVRSRINPDRQLSPEKAQLIEANRHEMPLTSVDRMALRSLGEVPWNDTPPAEEPARPLLPSGRPRMFAPETMTEPQERMIVRLLEQAEREGNAVYATAAPWFAEKRATMTKETASDVIGRLKNHLGYDKDWKRVVTPVAATAPAAAPVTKEGLYRHDGQLYQVMRGKDSDKLYAKRVDFVEGKKRPELTYIRGMIFKLRAEELVEAEEAQELTRKTGWCVFGHFLTNPKSIARGMGPKCWARYGGGDDE